MKNILTLLIVIICFHANAQTDYLEDQPSWYTEANFGNQNCWVNTESVYYLKGDTLIDSTMWHQVFARHLVTRGAISGSEDCGDDSYHDQLQFLLRSDGFQIFQKKEDEVERVLYNFDLETGDSLKNKGYLPEYASCVVERIDSIEMGDSTIRKFVIVDEYGYNSDIYEGIGKQYEPFETYNYNNMSPTTIYCFQDNLGQLSLTEHCNFALSSESITTPAETNLLLINHHSAEVESDKTIDQVFAYTTLGQSVDIHMTILSPKRVRVDFPSNVNQRLYVLVLQHTNGTSSNVKLLMR